ncbi:MAG: 3-oxoacyl-[acyl-carrier-protein] reductase [Omnitrophica WOR_2 bacterium]
MTESTSLSMEGRVAIVTGGSRGIGRTIAETLAKRGAQIVLADMQIDLAKTTAQEIASTTGCRVTPVYVDVSNHNNAKEMVETAIAEFGHVDILVNNAGVTRDTLIMRMEESDWDLVLNVNLKGVFNCSKAVIRPMMKQRYGRIVNISSVSGLAGQVGQTNYSASKAGIVGFTKALAREVASRQITVNAVAPGFVPTALTNDLPAELKDNFMKLIPLGRWASTQDIANAVAFLASDDASYITGQVLSVDGGMFMM